MRVWGLNSLILGRMQLYLTKKTKISDSGAVVCCADRSYVPYTFPDMHDEEEGKKKEEKQIKIFALNFLHCEED